MTDIWKISLPCAREEGEAFAGEFSFASGREPPVISAEEADESDPERWQVTAYVEGEPDEVLIADLLALVPSAARGDVEVERLPAQDWLTLSQQGLQPITAGRFHVYTAAHADTLRPGQIGIRIEAGQAFGTGQHATTAGCLTILDRLANTGYAFANILDLGTGSGILALAAVKRWPHARLIASDIDPVSVEVAIENVELNGERVGRGAGAIELLAADGFEDARLRARAPYDLVLANILAGPLVALAADIARVMAPGGNLLLAGLLTTQADDVIAAYVAVGCRLVERHVVVGDWPTLRLTRG
jgi:ribosomal protein L11 methyltransferase